MRDWRTKLCRSSPYIGSMMARKNRVTTTFRARRAPSYFRVEPSSTTPHGGLTSSVGNPVLVGLEEELVSKMDQWGQAILETGSKGPPGNQLATFRAPRPISLGSARPSWLSES